MENITRLTGQETRNKLTDYWSDHNVKKGEEFAILTNIISYVVSEDTREVVDITTLNAKIAKIVTRQNELRTAIDEIVVDIKSK